MKKIITPTLFLILIGISGIARAQSTKEILLNHVKAVRTTAELKDIKVSIKVDSLQKQSDKGIKFSIKIKNDSTVNLTILNPLETIRIALLDHSYHNIFIQDAPKALIHVVESMRTTYRGFIIEKFTSNGKEVKENVTDAETIILPAKGSFEIFYNVQKVLREDATIPYTPDQEVRLAAGHYVLTLVMNVLESQNKDAIKAPVRIMFKLPAFNINYGL